MRTRFFTVLFLSVFLCCWLVQPLSATRLKDIAELKGVRTNQVLGGLLHFIDRLAKDHTFGITLFGSTLTATTGMNLGFNDKELGSVFLFQFLSRIYSFIYAGSRISGRHSYAMLLK